MLNFEYCSPTNYVFGPDTQARVGELIESCAGAKKVLIVYGNDRIVKSGLYAQVVRALEEKGMEHVELSGVVPNPRISLVRQEIALAKAEKVDFVLPVGGGSVIDTGKAVACGAVYDGDVEDFFTGAAEPQDSLPVGVILTLSATGSEGSNCAVISLDSGEKAGICVDACRPRFAIMNPELTYTVPKWQTACGSADIMAHVLEPYFTRTEDVQLTDRLIEGLLKTVIAYAPVAIAEPENYNARAQLMWCGTLANSGFLAVGREGDTAPHALGEMLGGRFDKTHGATLSAVLPAWMTYTWRKKPQRYAQYARNVWGITEPDPEKAAKLGIEATREFFRSIGAPVSLHELGIDADRYAREMAEAISEGWDEVPGFFFDLTAEDRYQVYMLAK